MDKLNWILPVLLSATIIIVISACSENDTDQVYEGISGSESDRDTSNGIEHVIHISVDGLDPDSITTFGRTRVPAFYWLRDNGSYTDNARTDDLVALTLPNHTSQFSGRAVLGDSGHGMILNYGTEYVEKSIHQFKGDYVTSVFDMVHDYGMSTALFAGKSKFSLFQDSWGPEYGARDNITPDSGRSKIDRYVFEPDTNKLVDEFLRDHSDHKYNYAFLHLKDPDDAGHKYGWSLDPESEYMAAVMVVDGYLQKVLDYIVSDTELDSKTILILTADHSGEYGETFHHISRDDGYLTSSVIPFYVYGPRIPAATDLYSMNPDTTTDPLDTYPLFIYPFQPIRNGDVANLVTEILGLPNVTGSTIDSLKYPD